MKGPLRLLWLGGCFSFAWIAAAGSAAFVHPVEAAEASLADDAYHYADWADGRHDTWYTEWWYFNVLDAGVKAIFSYFITNPDDTGGLGQVQMVAAVYTADGTVSAIDLYPMGAFSASEAQADVSIETNAVRLQPGGSYLVSGTSRDQRIAWDLAYTGESEPWLAADRMTVGRRPWEQMSWLVAMPRARVTGQIRVDGRTYAVDAPGYHDHNWGEWVPTDGLWAWAQFSTPRLNLEVGDFVGKPIGVVSIDLDGTRTVFGPDQYQLTHTQWAWDPQNRLFYPSESELSADDGALRVRATLRVVQNEPLRGDLPLPLKDLIIYEQSAMFEGRVWERQPAADRPGGGKWRVKAWIRGPGFKEWTAKRY